MKIDNPIIKVCGLHDAENVGSVSQMEVDMLGFVFIPDSPNYVRMISSQAGTLPDYSEERLRKMVGNVPAGSGEEQSGASSGTVRRQSRVGVFKDEMPQTIVTMIYNYSLDFVQLNGAESRVMIDNLKRTLVPDIVPGIKIIKTIELKSSDDLSACAEYEGAVDLFLFRLGGDAALSASANASVEAPDNSLPAASNALLQAADLLRAYRGSTPFLIGAPFGLQDVGWLKDFDHPQWAGVNLSDSFETPDGGKDIVALQKFVEAFRQIG